MPGQIHRLRAQMRLSRCLMVGTGTFPRGEIEFRQTDRPEGHRERGQCEFIPMPRPVWLQQDFIGGLAVIAVAAFAFWQSADLPIGTLGGMGPAMLAARPCGAAWPTRGAACRRRRYRRRRCRT